ncbi:MAG TPA: hypothetical protein DEA32_00545 [Firmicutes bacterium]|nr:hypothetical protein [Bacillota bacterium]
MTVSVPPTELEVPPTELEVPPTELEVPPTELESPPSAQPPRSPTALSARTLSIEIFLIDIDNLL